MSELPFNVNIVADVQGQLLQTSRGDGQQASADPGKAAQTKLKAVLEISQALAAATAVEDILPQVLNTLMTQIFPIADRGSIMLLDPETGQMIPTAQQHKSGNDEVTVKLSRTVLDHVLKEKQGVRSVDAGTDDRFQNAASIALSEIHSMMCVPMLSLEGEAIGIIHVDSHSTFATFNADDMGLLVAIAGQTALAYDSARQMLKREQMRSEMEIARHRALSQMVSGLAHELNTPLGIMQSATSVIGDTTKELAGQDLGEDIGDDLEDMAEAVGLLQGNLTRASRLICEFKKLSTQQEADRREVVNLGELVQEIVDAAGTQPALKGHAVTFSNHLGDPNTSWDGYPLHLSQVLLSGLENAGCHAYAQEGGKIEVHVSHDKMGEQAAFRLQIVDYGAGIASDKLEEIFVPFFTTKRNRGHRGLGLAIARTIVHDSLRGTVQIHAAPNQGTMLTVTVPAAVPNPEAVPT
jgi:K+-sensing histidine kinase KdpD